MKRFLLISMLSVCAGPAQAQSASADSMAAQLISMRADMQLAGHHLLQFRRTVYTGYGLQGLGIVLLGAGISTRESNGWLSSNNSGGNALMIGGSVLAITGLMLTIGANYHVGEAGIIMKGNGVAVPIKGRKNRYR